MSWSDDTDALLEDGTVVRVDRISNVYTSSSVVPRETSTVIATATVLIFPKSGVFQKLVKGRVVKNTHLLFFPSTSTVLEGDRIFETGDENYHEVLHKADYDGHKQIYTEKVEGR